MDIKKLASLLLIVAAVMTAGCGATDDSTTDSDDVTMTLKGSS